MKSGTWCAARLLAACLILPILGLGQGGSAPSLPSGVGAAQTPAPQAGDAGTIKLIVQVLAEDGTSLTQQAFLVFRSESNQAETWKTVRGKSDVTFQGLLPGTYSLEVSLAGYRTISETIGVQNEFPVTRTTLILRRETVNAAAAVADSAIPKDARKDAQRGIEAFKAGKLQDAESYFANAYKRAPESADVNYLLGTVYLEKRDLAQAQKYLAKAGELDPKHVRALTSLGEVRFEQNDYAGGIKDLEKAVAADSQQWRAHWLLANGYLKQNDSQKAREQAELAIETGKGAAAAAQLPLGEALANLGKYKESLEAFEGYLRSVPNSPIEADVRGKIDELKAIIADPTAPVTRSTTGVAAKVGVSARPDVAMKQPTWGPPGVDDVRPVVKPGVVCPQGQVLHEAGLRLAELVENIARFDAVEEVVHEDQDEVGRARQRIAGKYEYYAGVSQLPGGVPLIEEDRKSLSTQSVAQAGITTSGLTALAFIFHPRVRESYDLACEGMGQWQGQPTWLVHFRQRDDRPNYIQRYRIGNTAEFVPLKGRAWMAADTYNIIHMEAELVRPLPKIKLLTEHYIVDYGAVMFKKKNVELWLPQKAELYFHFYGHRLYRRHAFDNFRLFSVDSTEKVKAPKAEPGDKPE